MDESRPVDKPYRDLWGGTCDPRPRSANVLLTSDGARQAVISSLGDSVNSGFLYSLHHKIEGGTRPVASGCNAVSRDLHISGHFNYICAVHDQLGMKGTIIVHP